MADVTAADVARRIDVPPAALRRWIPAAAESGRLAYGYLEQLFPGGEGRHSVEVAAERTGLEPALIRRMWGSLGFPAGQDLTEDDIELREYAVAVLQAGFPLIAFLQLIRVYGQALAQIADAEVKLFHLYVHEPLMRDAVPGLEMAEEMETLASDLLPLAAPVMDGLHRRLLRHVVEQDVVGHMEAKADFDLGRLRVAIACADLAGYTRLTEEAGEEQAVDVVERFVAGVEATLPDDARVVKTIGDEVMIDGSDAAALVGWAVGYQQLRFDQIGEVKLKGFSEPAELFVAEAAP